MKRFMTIAVALMFFFIGGKAQNNATTVMGVIVDSISSNPESYATVRVMQKGNATPVVVGLTDEKGTFNLAVPKVGSFELICSSIGKKPISKLIQVVKGQKLNVGTLRMSDAGMQLGEVKVRAQRPLVKAEIDKISYNMTEDPDAQTNTTLEMLRKVPMVTVDGEDNIQVNGSSSFKVYVNGKPNQMMSSNPSEIFKSYPASAIKKIEVITNPGAKYDAEGTAGVLNIITNTETSMKGYSLTTNLRLDNRGEMGSLFGMVQLGKFTLSAHYGIGYHHNPTNLGWSERETFNDLTNHLLTSNSRNKGNGVFQFGSLDGSYEFSEKDLLSFSAGIHGHTGHNYSHGDNVMTNNLGATVYSYHQDTRSHHRNPYINFSTDYQHTFKEDQTLTLSYQMSTSPGTSYSYNIYSDLQNIPFALTDLYSKPENKSYEHTGQLDFTTPLAKGHMLSTGLKYVYRINKSDNEEFSKLAGSSADFVLDDNRSLRYRHRGDVAAAYAEYNLKLDHFSAMAGTRYEYYRIHVTYPDGKRSEYKTDLGDLVPSLSMGYNLTESQMLRLGYNMRIERPDINALSPYVSRATPETASYGNPNLKTAKAHNVELGYSIFKTKFNLNTTLSYNFSNNGITDYSFIDGSSVLNSTYDNFLHSKQLNLGIFMNWTIVDGTRININGGTNYRDLSVEQTGDHNHGFSAHCWGGITQDLPWKLKLELWSGGHLRNVQLQGKGSSFMFYSLNLSRTFLKENRLRVSLRAGNFLNRYKHFRNETLTETFRTASDRRADMLRLGFGISYRLGSLKAEVKRAKRSIENNDMQQSSGDESQGGGNEE